MARYPVTIVLPNGELATRLLVVLSQDMLCSDLLDKIKSRYPTESPITLRWNSADGPILHADDSLGDTLVEASDVVFAVLSVSQAPISTLQSASQSINPHMPQPRFSSLKVRVITPELARSHPNIKDIPLIAGKVTTATTLKQLRGHVEQHLGMTGMTQMVPNDGHKIFCNCNFARQVDSHTILQDYRMTALGTVVIVHDHNQVTTIPIDEPKLESIKRAVKQKFPNEVAQNIQFIIGGVKEQFSGPDFRYLKLPVVALCSSIRHKALHDNDIDREANKTAVSLSRMTVVDMHTSEMPIHITAHNQDTSLQAAHLNDITVDGVLNIYAVKRFAPSDSTDVVGHSEGKNETFGQNPAWEHPLGQSDRGLANFLSSLRVFTNRIHPKEMGELEQDSVLHMIMLLTQFPPTVRAVKILMRGETPLFSERASIVQCFYEVLKDVVPSRVIKKDPTRLLEGSRLLFGLILEKAKHLKVIMCKDEERDSPYATSFTVHELRNLMTMEPVVDPIQTSSGLVDHGFMDAFRADGSLLWTNGNSIGEILTSEKPLIRACLLSGGVNSQTISFSIDAIATNNPYADGGDIKKVINSAELSDLQYLSTLSGRNGLVVIQPSALPSTDPPVLTLDRKGLLAVYVGRQACGQAGRDINMFRPTNDVVEESVDVSIITQLLVPILAQYAADGTGIFESFGDQSRQIKEPDEIIMICADASASMHKRCGFVDIEENEDAENSLRIMNTESDKQSNAENSLFDRSALDELKEYLAQHESFQDMLAITQNGNGDFYRAENAGQIIELLRLLLYQEIQAKTKQLETLPRTYHNRKIIQNTDRDLAILQNRRISLTRYKDALVAFLLFRAENTTLDQVLTWSGEGDAVPKIPKKSSSTISIKDLKFAIPADYICPISSDLMENPVSTIDEFTYERRNIERWLQSHETSPCTNLILEDMELTPNHRLKQSIDSWRDGTDMHSGNLWPSGDVIKVLFQSPLDDFFCQVPSNITLKNMYHQAFRATKGRYKSFSLRHRNTILFPSAELARNHLPQTSTITVTPIDQGHISALSNSGHEDLYLIKVYKGTYNKTDFSYWESKRNSKTLASIFFRYYRHYTNVHRLLSVPTITRIWTNMRHRGDRIYGGNGHNHWESLPNLLNSITVKGQLIDEPIYEQESNQHSASQGNHGRNANEPLVLKVLLFTYKARSYQAPLSRLDVLKQMVGAFVNRILAYGYQTHIGLVTFRSEPSLTQGITHAIENFRHELNNCTASGDTALWDALSLARDTLIHYGAKYPKAKLRIICLSDGDDTKSKQAVHDVAAALVHDRIIVDSFCLGADEMKSLYGISHITGGYKFQPDQLEHAMAICELEPVLSVLERPDITLPKIPPHYDPFSRLRSAISQAKIDVVDRDVFPLRKEHPLLSKSYIELGSFRHTGTASRFDIASRNDTNMRLSRIHNEIRNSAAKGHPHYDIYVCESNMAMWKIVMQGPFDSAYASGTFLLYLEMGDDYPTFPPKGRFITPVYHPNINRHGRICHSIFDRNWTVDTTNKDIIDTIYSLLLVPEFSDPINTVVTLKFHWDEVQFKEEAERHIQKHAVKNRAEWKQDIVG